MERTHPEEKRTRDLPDVEKLWMNGAFPVDGLSADKFFPRRRARSEPGTIVRALSRLASLVWQRSVRTIQAAPDIFGPSNRPDVNTAVHRFQETIGGHPYLIEVTAVAQNRWRAYIVRIPGVPTALMPFYGPTPDEAAGQLRQWLTRAHERAGRR
jgi:hypothetical protein